MAEKKADAMISGPQARYTDTDNDGIPNRSSYTSDMQTARGLVSQYRMLKGGYVTGPYSKFKF
jgi:hypothetical protein